MVLMVYTAVLLVLIDITNIMLRNNAMARDNSLYYTAADGSGINGKFFDKNPFAATTVVIIGPC